MIENDEEWTDMADADEALSGMEAPPTLPDTLSQDERYFTLLTTALNRCKAYRPRFGQSKSAGVTVEEFVALYSSDPFTQWLGLDSPLLYTAHKAAGGLASIYRQIGVGSRWILFQMLQDCLGLTTEQAAWNYTVEGARGKPRTLALDGRIEMAHVTNQEACQRLEHWLHEVAATLGLPGETVSNLKGVVFEARQGYKSKDAKRLNADVANAAKAYAHLYLPVLLLFSTQIEEEVAHRYKENMWLLLTGTAAASPTTSMYAFCREVIGCDLADFFTRYSPRIKAEIEDVLKTLLSV